MNVLGNGSGGASTSGQASACAGEERPSLFWRHLVQQRGMNLSIWELMSF